MMMVEAVSGRRLDVGSVVMRLIMAHLILRFSAQGDQLTLEAFGLCLRSSTLYDSDERMLTAAGCE
jgi:hypothetical protein